MALTEQMGVNANPLLDEDGKIHHALIMSSSFEIRRSDLKENVHSIRNLCRQKLNFKQVFYTADRVVWNIAKTLLNYIFHLL